MLHRRRRPGRRRPGPGSRTGQGRLRGRAGAVPDRDRHTGRRGPAGAGFTGARRHLHLRRAARAALLPGHSPARRARGPTSPSPPRWRAWLGVTVEGRAASLVFAKLAAEVPAYAGLTYQTLAEVAEQWPHRRPRRPVLRRHHLREQAGPGRAACRRAAGRAACASSPGAASHAPALDEQAAAGWCRSTRLYDRGHDRAATPRCSTQRIGAAQPCACIPTRPRSLGLAGRRAGDWWTAQTRLAGRAWMTACPGGCGAGAAQRGRSRSTAGRRVERSELPRA